MFTLPPLKTGTLIKRYKRFLADIRLEDGTVITAHCPNSGSMLSVAPPEAPVAISISDNPKRKLPYTWEMVYINNCWVVVNTSIPNNFVFEALNQNKIPQLEGYTSIRREVPYGKNSRIDILLEAPEKPPCFVEIKNVTLSRKNKEAQFPDAKTTRGLKHLGELIQEKKKGHRAVMLYLVNREDCESFSFANDIDPAYAEGAQQAFSEGVECLILRTKATLQKIVLDKALPLG